MKSSRFRTRTAAVLVLLFVAPSYANNFDTFLLDPKLVGEVEGFLEHGGWGDPSLAAKFRIIQISADGCEIQGKSIQDCRALTRNGEWDSYETIVLRAPGLPIALLRLRNAIDARDSNVRYFSNALTLIAALDEARVKSVTFGTDFDAGVMAGAMAPAYADYRIRELVGGAFEAAAGCKTLLAEFIQTNAVFPTKEALGNLVQRDLCISENAAAEILPDIGVVVSKFNTASGINHELHEKSVWFTLDLEKIFETGVFNFQCLSNLSQKFLPRGCAGDQELAVR